MKRFFICLAALFIFGLPVSLPAAQPEGPESIVVNRIAAVVNGEIITLHELRQHSAGEFMRMGVNPRDPASRATVNQVMSQVLSAMIDDILLRQEAERLKIKVSETEIDNELNKMVQRNQTSLREFEARVAAQGGTMAMVKERIRNNLLSQRIIGIQIARKIMVTSEEVSAYYEQHKNEFQANRGVDVSLIVFSPSSNAADVLRRIQSGSLTFEAAAKQFSEGPAPDQGGRLGMINWDDLAPPLKAQVVDLQKGEVGTVFHINGRDYLVKLNDTTPGRNMSLEEATPEIERLLREPRMQERFTEFTQQLRGRAVIDIRV